MSSLLNHLERRRHVASDGRVTYTNTLLNEEAFTLEHALIFGSDLVPEDREAIVHQALFADVPPGKTLKDAILAKVRDGVAAHHRLPNKKLIIATGISVRPESLLPSFSFGDVRISFPSTLPIAIVRARDELLEQIGSQYPSPPGSYRPARIGVNAKTANEAINKGLDALDLVRGIWNFFLNRGRRRGIHGRPYQPVNMIRGTDSYAA